MADTAPTPPAFDPEAVIDAMAPLLGITVDPAFRPGVLTNLGVIAAMAALVDGAAIDEREEPAPVYRP
ncbi:DUF4089 domain-containing protein [Alsobacter sp. R-9]